MTATVPLVLDIADLTPEWLSAALGRRVDAVTPTPVGADRSAPATG